MLVLGVNTSHCATACLLKDGKIISCLSEERLTRVKNQNGFPSKALSSILKEHSLLPSDIDALAFSFKDMTVNANYFDYSTDSPPNLWYVKQRLLSAIPVSKYPYHFLLDFYYNRYLFPRLESRVFTHLEKKYKISRHKVHFVNHHLSHAYSAYFSSPPQDNPKLVFTLDGMGDGLSSTVNIGQGESLDLIASSPDHASLGMLYSQVTSYLGMKANEHEYKVMGLAPYASRKHAQDLLSKLSALISLDVPSLSFKSRVSSFAFHNLLPGLLAGERFDTVALALQMFTENLITSWVKAAVKKTKIGDIVCAGGVFMNVKVNKLLSELPEVSSIYVMPSASDESSSIGASYFAYLHLKKTSPSFLPPISPLGALYLGPEYTNREALAELKKLKHHGLKYKKYPDTEKQIARLLARGKIVARFRGRMEWGARALGNRSILANPAELSLVRQINEQIKSRDFWMPFAPSILSEDMSSYLVNPRKIPAPYMILALDTVPGKRHHLQAAIHQYDFTARPQEVIKSHNPSFHALISEFKRLTSIPAVLNTSFNLHGYPIVNTPSDALKVFLASGLEYLALEDYMVFKLKSVSA